MSLLNPEQFPQKFSAVNKKGQNNEKKLIKIETFIFETAKFKLQWNLNNPVTCGAVLFGCNKEVIEIQLTSTKQSHPFLAQMAVLHSTST